MRLVHLLPIPLRPAGFVVSSKKSLLLTHFRWLLGETINVLHQWYPILSLQWCGLYVFPDFETHLPHNFDFKSVEKFSCYIDWSSNVCYFKTDLYHTHSYMRSSTLVELLPCGSNGCVISGDDLSFCCFPQRMFKSEKCHVDWWKIFRVDWHLGFRGRENVRTESHRGVCFPLGLKFLVLVNLDPEGTLSTPRGCISNQHKLTPWEVSFKASSQASSRVLFLESIICLSSDVVLIGASALISV